MFTLLVVAQIGAAFVAGYAWCAAQDERAALRQRVAQ